MIRAIVKTPRGTIERQIFSIPDVRSMALSQLSEVDKQMLRLLIESEGTMPTHEISQQLGVPLSTVQRRRKRLEENYLVKSLLVESRKVWLASD